ncbi:MAG: saccharopine dehydrogenase NADP-binding domain-containing protein [Robiginitomaculum sp.]|nr:saccharopine dehydrogenase NADP-binding domain-containing protein [Robiginitomaculum sp.]
MTILIYGATGFTGRLCAHEAVRRNAKVILAGRNAEKLAILGQQTGLETRVFDLSDSVTIDNALGDVSTVLHIAGPFSATAEPMVQSCLRTKTNYLDITGEIGVFEAHAKLDAAAKKQKVMIMSGVGFDVVPTDCLAVYVKQQLPDATDLVIGVSGMSTMTRGTTKSGIEGIRFGTRVRRNKEIVQSSKSQVQTLDFGQGIKPVVAMSWGDVSTAWYSTKIPNISVYFEASKQFEMIAKLGRFSRWMLGTALIQKILKSKADKMPEGPSEKQMREVSMHLVAIATNAAGKSVTATMKTPEAYSFTAKLALEIALRTDGGFAKQGFQTPAMVFGSNFVTEFAGVERKDVV